jgi:hypothetical protein
VDITYTTVGFNPTHTHKHTSSQVVMKGVHTKIVRQMKTVWTKSPHQDRAANEDVLHLLLVEEFADSPPTSCAQTFTHTHSHTHTHTYTYTHMAHMRTHTRTHTYTHTHRLWLWLMLRSAQKQVPACPC